ncbi:hypothetical protein Pcinc_013509 [Petrolisthes cinctipes]|uniref:Uncharacterized protein n=1 Tax=Petrolisthes cinctipes TaxID=88211 RepID=A0AAE1FWS3_PETCI|nr:hypothetical protein Pcinc_013509 [Petrolisthes cinctipes]
MVLSFLTSAGVVVLYILRINLSVAIVAMVDLAPTPSTTTTNNNNNNNNHTSTFTKNNNNNDNYVAFCTAIIKVNESSGGWDEARSSGDQQEEGHLTHLKDTHLTHLNNNDTHLTHLNINDTSTPQPDEGDGSFKMVLTSTQRGLVLGAFFYGYALTNIPGGRLAEMYGTKIVFGGAILIGGVLTLFIPLAARAHYIVLVILRALLGLSNHALHTPPTQQPPPPPPPTTTHSPYTTNNNTLSIHHHQQEHPLHTPTTTPTALHTPPPTTTPSTYTNNTHWSTYTNTTTTTNNNNTLSIHHQQQHPLHTPTTTPTALCTLQGVVYPAMNVMVARWIPPLERSRFMSITFTSNTLGTIITMPVCGFLIAWVGWPSVFYFSGGVSLLWVLMWGLLMHDTPLQHPRISPQERDYIIEALNAESKKEKPTRTPWRSIMTSLPVWATTFAQIGSMFGFNLLLTQLPTYLATILGFTITDNGMLSALPFLAQFLGSVSFGFLSDWLLTHQYIPVKTSRKLFCTISTLMGVSNTIAFLVSICVPIIVGAMTPDQTLGQWQGVFWLTAAFYVINWLFYVILCSTDIQPWNYQHEEEDLEEKEALGEEEEKEEEEEIKVGKGCRVKRRRRRRRRKWIRVDKS